MGVDVGIAVGVDVGFDVIVSGMDSSVGSVSATGGVNGTGGRLIKERSSVCIEVGRRSTVNRVATAMDAKNTVDFVCRKKANKKESDPFLGLPLGDRNRGVDDCICFGGVIVMVKKKGAPQALGIHLSLFVRVVCLVWIPPRAHDF